MSTYEFKLPDIGEGVTEGEVVKWLVKPGDPVGEDQPMVEVMTDKATVTITSPKAGTILETRAAVGAVVPVHSVLVVLDLGGGGASAASHVAPAAAPAAKKEDGPAATAVGDIKEDLPGMSLMTAAPKPQVNGHAAARVTDYFNDKPLATPATRKMARDLGVDLRTVPPSGKGGRVTKDDLERQKNGSSASAPLPPPAARTEAAAPTATQAPRAVAPLAVGSAPADKRTPLRGVRKRIFEGMARSKHTAAHFTFVEECDASAMIALRDRLRPAAEKAGVKLTYLPFITKAVVAALKKHPSLASAFDEVSNEIVERAACHIGIATSTDMGLIVPVVRDADRKSILDVARDIARLGEDAKAGKVRPEDLGGSVFTITSLGAQGGLFATPILNHPEVGILGVHQIKEKPVVKNGQIVVGNVMLLSLSFDHRIIDGHVGAAFAYEIIGYLQDPDRLFLEMA
ncbi:MAG TPA: dihydrolipoamide acetyltransferase family protein [Polyangiaceae bacterium]|jgi:pyruvate dehydrogenase E2 component (dihydrolipoamide acetyltransferase)|nr:dihydrolipoamide acetyltransferase family protein [Polyangiaceae bacterium]